MLNSERQLLVAEDNPVHARVIAFVLKQAGYTVSIAHDGDTAWRLLNEQEFDLMVSDIAMPGKTGTELCELMRENKRLANIPVILLTAKFFSSAAPDCDLISPVRAFLTKPVNRHDLSIAVAECFANSGAAE